jgi:hypothetical protein
VPNVGSFFFPFDIRLGLGVEGYSPSVLRKAVRQATKAASFQEASDDLRELAELTISPVHLHRLSERIGQEWIEVRDEEVERFRTDDLPRSYRETPRGAAAAVMLDGGRVQMRAEGAGRGVREEHWRETKVACCLTLQTQAQETDPEPEPPSKFLEPKTAARLASDIKRRSRPATERTSGKGNEPSPKRKSAKRGGKRKRRSRKRTRVRTVVATLQNSEAFGWLVAAEVHRRGLDRMKRKACVCDGQAYNWSIYEMHLLALGFIAILDFVHLLAYLYDAAHAWHGAEGGRGWKTYEQWLRWAWSGKVTSLLGGLRTALTELREHGRTAAAATVEEALTYVTNNRQRMDYPEYRRLGLPISSAPVESTIKQINRRVKGTEKFWGESGVEAMLQLRAAQLRGYFKTLFRPFRRRRLEQMTQAANT